MKSLAIIVVTFNGARYIARFLDTLHTSLAKDDYTLVVVDNHSTDDTVQKIRALMPAAHIIGNTENKGFAEGNNQGMRYALSRGAKWVMLANQDVSFGDDWWTPLREQLEKDQSLGALQPLILLYPETEKINSCGNALHFLGFGFTNGYRKTPSEWACTAGEVGYCSGAAVVYTREALEKVGLFDETYFMYHEDTDLSWRMNIAGYRTAVEPASYVFHEYEFSRSIGKFYYIERNRLVTLLKNYQLRTLILILPALVFWEVGLLLYALLGKLLGSQTITFQTKLRVIGSLLSAQAWSHIFHERKKIRNIRVVPDREITKKFTARIEFQDVSNPLLSYVANPLTQLYWHVIKNFI